VRALDVVGLDLELRDRDGLGLAVEQQVPVRLVGVGLLRAGVDDDHAGVHGAAGVAQRTLEQQVGVGVVGGVVLDGVLVVVLPLVGEVQPEHLGLGARDPAG
jgi:hypothetical protein